MATPVLLADNLAAENFLVPNATFIVELVLFVVVLAVVSRYVVPPLQGAMRRRAEIIRAQFEEAREAGERAEAAEAEYHRSMNEARAEATRIRAEARAQGQQVIEELTTVARQEADRVIEQGREQLAAERAELVRELRAEMDALAVDLASRIVGESLAPATASEGRR